MDLDWSMSDDFVGLLLLGVTCGLLLIASVLAVVGLNRAKEAAEKPDEDTEKLRDAANKTRDAATKVKNAAASARTAAETLQPAGATQDAPSTTATLNQAEQDLADAETALEGISFEGAQGTVQTAIGELKGPLAPAGAFLAFALLTFTLSLVAFGLISFSVSPDTGGDTTTTVTTPEGR